MQFCIWKRQRCGRRNVHAHRAHRTPEECGQNANAPEPGTGTVPRRGKEPYAGDSAPDRDGRHQTQDRYQPGKGNPVLLTGSNEDMKRMEEDGRLDGWCSDNLKWLRETYGERNLVSAVLHMDEKTLHIHATIVPIVTGERRKARQDEQNGKKKYRKKNTQDVRLCADDAMARHKLKHYQDTYAQAMSKYGLQRGVDGSLAKHIPTSQYYKELVERQDSLQGEHRKPAGAGRGSAEEAEKGQGGNQRAEDEGCGGERNHSHSGQGEFSFGRQQGQEAGSGERKFEAGHCGSAKAGTSRTEGADKNGEPPQQRDKQDRPELPAKIREYDNRLEQIDTYFPIVKELLPIAEQCREVGFTEELTRRVVSLQPVEFKGRLYSKEHKEKFRTEHSTATVERNPQEKGKFRLCIDGMPILEWFKMKFQELKEKLGVSHTQKKRTNRKEG